MKKALVVIDMQNDFITGVLGSPAAEAIVPNVAKKIEEGVKMGSSIIFTRDTHSETYPETIEGQNLPLHCLKDTYGWEICDEAAKAAEGYKYEIFDKTTFGSIELSECLKKNAPWDEIEIVGLASSICVITNALMIKAYLPDTIIAVPKDCTAGITEEDYLASLKVMGLCHIQVR